ncbi:unnamed protein product [Pelagomonas calceolata]|uniref:SOCS box domain-containing protein n=1 Tax=Pelagomonas calceolata TaxID=35677 RepID=A0A7S4EDM0_9STRA|nr:unnamed protein product [Pelagomonas calceolata]|mmetsp:Transcript_15020/g.42652  ORF Transcript_15020/g.42652 Transcript_15020/m.42652 type:complete len:301 (-) Transcript_15020:29-931(-)
MVVPDNVVTAVNEGDVSTVVAWLDGGGDVNDTASHSSPFFPGDTLLMGIPQADGVSTQHIELAKILLQRGGDVNCIPDDGEDEYSALHCCLDCLAPALAKAVILEIIGIYLAAGASVNHKNWGGETPLYMALKYKNWYTNDRRRPAFDSVKLLLRAGASLDDVCGSLTAEDVLDVRGRGFDELANDEHYIACKQLVADLRAAGSWKNYARVPPKELLRLRSLVARGRARSIKRLRAKTPRELELLFAPTFPNELCWRVLKYWNPRHEALRAPSASSHTGNNLRISFERMPSQAALENIAL